jgi:4-amino-4-deoxy-L-arabinose transferase-like glycosyltransferase
MSGPEPDVRVGGAPARKNWRPQSDPLVWAAGAVSLVVYSLHGFNGVLIRDLGVYAYAAQHVVEGEPPYVGILNRAGPLAHLIPAIGVVGARIVGIDDLLGMRLLFMVISVGCVCLCYLLGRDLFSSRLAGLASAAALLSLSGFTELASNGPREKTAMVFFLLWTLWSVVRRWWFTSGVFVSLATLVWQPAFFVGIAAILVAVLVVPRRARMRALARVTVGGLLPAVIMVIYFALAGALSEFIDGYLLINLRYTEPAPFTSYFSQKVSRLRAGYGRSLLVMVVGLATLAYLSVAALRRQNRRDAAQIMVVAMGTAAFIGLMWIYRDFNSWPDSLVVVPMVAVGVGGLVHYIVRLVPLRFAAAVALVWVVVATAYALHYSVVHQNHQLNKQRRSADALLRALPPGATFLSVKAPSAMVLAHKTNPNRFQMFTLGLQNYVDDTWPGGLRGYGEWIGRQHPTVIAVDKRAIPNWLEPTIAAQYRKVGGAPRITWYVNRSVGDGVRARLHTPD